MGKDFHPARDGGGKKGGPAEAPRKEGEVQPSQRRVRAGGAGRGALMEQAGPSIGSLGPGDQVKGLSA